ncbi:MAG: dipeptide epimerase, partial [Flavobacteriales bacterium]|nr:dipeptide epimerase [Flavobacteriales bacterium]
LKEVLESRSIINSSPEIFFEEIAPILTDDPFLLSALDCAAHDLFCKSKLISLSKYWNNKNPKQLLTNYTVSIGSSDEMISEILLNPWPVYKLKMSPDELPYLNQIKKNTKAKLRIDANTSWSIQDVLDNQNLLLDSGVELLEQPLGRDKWAQMEELFKLIDLPLIADESCTTLSDIKTCQSRFHGVNIKLPKCGGLIKAREMIKAARDIDLRIMIGCMSGSSISMAPLYHLAQNSDFVDMDGAILLKEDIAVGPKIHNGIVSMKDMPGVGFVIKPEFEF